MTWNTHSTKIDDFDCSFKWRKKFLWFIMLYQPQEVIMVTKWVMDWSTILLWPDTFICLLPSIQSQVSIATHCCRSITSNIAWSDPHSPLVMEKLLMQRDVIFWHLPDTMRGMWNCWPGYNRECHHATHCTYCVWASPPQSTQCGRSPWLLLVRLIETLKAHHCQCWVCFNQAIIPRWST